MSIITQNMFDKVSRKMQDSAKRLVEEAMREDIPEMLAKNKMAELKLAFKLGQDGNGNLCCTGKMQSASKETIDHEMIDIIEDDQPDLFDAED